MSYKAQEENWFTETVLTFDTSSVEEAERLLNSLSAGAIALDMSLKRLSLRSGLPPLKINTSILLSLKSNPNA